MTGQDQSSVLVNGQANDDISSLDRGLLYGDGVFETIAVQDGRPRFWLRHLARLAAGCTRLGIPSPRGTLLLEEARGLIADRKYRQLLENLSHRFDFVILDLPPVLNSTDTVGSL